VAAVANVSMELQLAMMATVVTVPRILVVSMKDGQVYF